MSVFMRGLSVCLRDAGNSIEIKKSNRTEEQLRGEGNISKLKTSYCIPCTAGDITETSFSLLQRWRLGIFTSFNSVPHKL